MEYRKQRINFHIRIYDGKTNLDKVIFDSNPLSANTGLTAYSYQDSIRSIDGRFSLTIADVSIVSKICILDVVQIQEYGKTRYLGVVENLSFSKRMQDNKPCITAVVSGYSVCGIISRLDLVMDRAVIGTLIPQEERIKFTENMGKKYNPGESLGGLVQDITDSFLKIMEGNLQTNALFSTLIRNHIDLVSGVESLKLKYPVAMSYLGVELQTLWQAIRKAFPAPWYEVYSAFDLLSEKYKLVVRNPPFLKEKWERLARYALEDVFITAIDLNRSSKDCYSYFLCTIPSSDVNRNLVNLQNENLSAGEDDYDSQGKDDDGIKTRKNSVSFDDEMMDKYGFRPLYVQMNFFDHERIKEVDLCDFLMSVTGDLKEMYSKNDLLMSGTIESIHDHSAIPPGVRLACKSGEFYVETIEVSWSFGSHHKRKFYVTRGYNYKRDCAIEIKEL